MPGLGEGRGPAPPGLLSLTPAATAPGDSAGPDIPGPPLQVRINWSAALAARGKGSVARERRINRRPAGAAGAGPVATQAKQLSSGSPAQAALPARSMKPLAAFPPWPASATRQGWANLPRGRSAGVLAGNRGTVARGDLSLTRGVGPGNPGYAGLGGVIKEQSVKGQFTQTFAQHDLAEQSVPFTGRPCGCRSGGWGFESRRLAGEKQPQANDLRLLPFTDQLRG